MQLFRSILFSSCIFSSIALAVPVLESQQKRRPGSFKIKQVRNPHYQLDGPAEIRRAYGKYGLSAPKRSDQNLASRAGSDVGRVTNQPILRDKEFLSPVSIGGQTFLMNFDTGSSDLWVFSTLIPEEQAGGRQLFNPNGSSTFKPLDGQRFNVNYGDGSFANGPVGTDVVNIGGASVEAQAIGLANNVSRSFTTDPLSQGLVGLAFSKLNRIRPVQQKTFFSNVAPSLAAPVLTADLKKGAPGTYEFGNIDESLFVGNLTFTNVDSSKGFWGFSPSRFVINGQEVNLANSSAIADTGTTIMLVDPALVEAYYANVKGAVNGLRGFGFPCGQKLPDLGIEIEGRVFTVPGSLIDLGQADPDAPENICFGGLQAIPSPPMIFGDVFFKSVLVVFDGGSPPKLGFGEQDLGEAPPPKAVG